ncbi:MAG: hypothetical protein ACFE89_03130 [Candidatus Hodarchaeota archaeon]
MSEVAAFREYRLNHVSADQSNSIVSQISKLMKTVISPNVCEIDTSMKAEDPSRIVISMKCVDGSAVHYADVRSMFKIMQLCEKDHITHDIGDLEVILD